MIKVTADKFNEYASADSIAVGEENFSCDEIELTKPTVKVTIPESDIMTFSSDKALDFSVEGLKAYVVTEVKAKNDAAYTSRRTCLLQHPTHHSTPRQPTRARFGLSQVPTTSRCSLPEQASPSLKAELTSAQRRTWIRFISTRRTCLS